MTAALEGGEWSAACPGRTLPPGKTRYPFYRRLGGAPGPVWTGGKSRPHRDSIPDRPARSQSHNRLIYSAHNELDCKARKSKNGLLLETRVLVLSKHNREF